MEGLTGLIALCKLIQRNTFFLCVCVCVCVKNSVQLRALVKGCPTHVCEILEVCFY